MRDKQFKKLMNGISQDAPMLKYLLSKGIPFEDQHKGYKLKHCEKRSDTNKFACVHGLMDLHVDSWREDQFQYVSVTHYYEQNGDMCKDPDIVFRFNKRNWEIDERLRQLTPKNQKDIDYTTYPFNTLMEIPISYQLDSLGIYHETYVTVNGKEGVKLELIGELQDLLKTMANHCRTWNYYLENKNE